MRFPVHGFFAAIALLVAPQSACAQMPAPQTPEYPVPPGFVNVASLIPGALIEMRYVGDDNFLGRPVAGYHASVCYLTQSAADALAGAQQQLATVGLGVKIFDCYRPASAVADFVAWARDPADQSRKTINYPNVDKARLFELGYIAERSGHSRGSTVDLTLIDLATQAELDMGGVYDLFDERSWPTSFDVSPQQRANRLLLQSVMRAHDFRPLAEEWWHFTLNAEPFADTYFDFPVR